MRGEFDGLFIIKQIKKPWLYPVVFPSTLREAARALIKKYGETLDYISCFALHFFRTLAASYKVLCNTTDNSQGFLISVLYSLG